MAPRPKSKAVADLFGGREPVIAGFALVDELVSPAEERALIAAIDGVELDPFRVHGWEGKRRTRSFGWRYDFEDARFTRTEPIPTWLLPVRDKAAGFAGLRSDDFAHALLIRYDPGAGIGWHRDKPMFEDVVAFSFLAPCTLRFRRKQGDGWARFVRRIAPRSAYLLRGPSRFLWEHSIPALDALRYSVTFRTFRAGAARG